MATQQVKQVEAVADDVASTARRPDAVMDRAASPDRPRSAASSGRLPRPSESPPTAPSPGHHLTHRLESHREPGLVPDREHGQLGRADARQP